MGKTSPITEKTADYFILPMTFKSFGDSSEIISNMVGDSIICPKGTANRIVTGQLETSESIYHDLAANFIIGQGDIDPYTDILALRFRTKKAFLSEFTGLHIFVVTLRCNQSCVYCQVNSQNCNQKGLDISNDTLDKSIELMFRSPAKSLTVEFQGGETLLAFDKIKYAVEKIKLLNIEMNRTISFVICTNLQSVSAEILEYVKHNNIILSTSLDGPKALHNKNRPLYGGDSHDRFERALSLSRQHIEMDNISALITITRESFKYSKEIVDEYARLGFSSIFLRPLHNYGQAVQNADAITYSVDKFLEFFKTTLDYIIQLNLSGINFREEYSSIILRKILSPFSVGFTDLESPNGVINAVLVYNYDGNVYPSDEARMLSESGDVSLRLGNVHTDTYENIVQGEQAQNLSLFWANESLAGCSECPYMIYCGADPIGNYNTYGDYYGRRYNDSFCTLNMGMIEHLFDLINSSGLEVKSLLQSWAFNSAPNFLGEKH